MKYATINLAARKLSGRLEISSLEATKMPCKSSKENEKNPTTTEYNRRGSRRLLRNIRELWA